MIQNIHDFRDECLKDETPSLRIWRFDRIGNKTNLF
jgi:hypothetical protein